MIWVCLKYGMLNIKNNVLLINPKDKFSKKIAENESVDLEFVGVLTEKPIIYCYGENDDLNQLDLKKALYEFPKRMLILIYPILPKTNIQEWISCDFNKAVDLVFNTLK